MESPNAQSSWSWALESPVLRCGFIQLWSRTHLPLPSHFEKASQLVSAEKIAETIPCGPDPEKHLKAIREYIDAGYDHIAVHRIGPKQKEFMEFYEREIFPKISITSEYRIPAA